MALVGACTTPARKINWSLNNASRADGVITLATDYNSQQKAYFVPEEKNRLAVEKCAVWGYKGAQAFGQTQTSCLVVDRSGNCVRTRLTTKYQCVGSPNP
ncbi:MAG: YecR-like lipofamily protein [Zoogloeaceae bacterium]|jgi:hypothetical protein|nr:YecR-like lipofamily protein [Zoogloeaceae bacterium]